MPALTPWKQCFRLNRNGPLDSPLKPFFGLSGSIPQSQSKMLRSTTRQLLRVTLLTCFHGSEETQIPLLAI